MQVVMHVAVVMNSQIGQMHKYQHTHCSQSSDQIEILVLIVITEAVDGVDS